MKPTATGSHQRIRFEKIGVTPPQHCILHATLVTYDLSTGILTALFDAQPEGAAPVGFTPQADGTYLDDSGRAWKLIN